MLSKPKPCGLCRVNYISTGFVADTGDPAKAQLAIVADSPSRSDLLEEKFWGGDTGRWYEKRHLTPHGLTRADVLFSSVIRCKPPLYDWPDGAMGKIGAQCCRQYDTKLIEFNPSIAIVSFGLDDIAKTPALFRLVQATFEKALRFRDRGFRPAILMGAHAAELVYPWMSGIKRWVGHFEEINGWPFKG